MSAWFSESQKAFSDSSIRRSRHPAPSAQVRSINSLFSKPGCRSHKLVKRSLTTLFGSGRVTCSTKLQTFRRLRSFPSTLIVLRAGSAGLRSPRAIKLQSNTEGFAGIHYSGRPHSTERSYLACSSATITFTSIRQARTPGQAAGGSSLPFPVRKSSFIRTIAFVTASGSLRCSGCKYPALISFAIMSLSPKRGADGITSLIGEFRTLLLAWQGNSLQIWLPTRKGLPGPLTGWGFSLRN